MNKLVKVISPRKEREVPKYFREFWIHNQKTNKRSDKADILGYSFPCFEDGTVDTNDSSYESWKQNYEYCISHPEELTMLVLLFKVSLSSNQQLTCVAAVTTLTWFLLRMDCVGVIVVNKGTHLQVSQFRQTHN